jgi:hypothetical protein
MKIDLDTRLTIAFIGGLLGLAWQAAIVSFGGDPSDALVTACSTIILAALGIGIKDGSGDNK